MVEEVDLDDDVDEDEVVGGGSNEEVVGEGTEEVDGS